MVRACLICAEIWTHNIQVTLELGGKSPVLVFEDADLNNAASQCAQSIVANSGQICAAHSRVYVQKSVAIEFSKKYVAAINSMTKAGDPLAPETTQGPQAE
jgi:aldehyde dehydrogenase (NAD+)